MQRPTPLRSGDRIRIVAPSGTFSRSRFDAGVQLLEQWGLTVEYGDELFSSERYLAGSDARRIAELNAAIADTDAAAIWVARGGYGLTRILDAVDVEALEKRRPWVVGFSDPTALHACCTNVGLPSMHAANMTTLGEWKPDAVEALRAMLFGEDYSHVLPGECAIAGDPVTAAVVGGNLAVLAALAGTPHLPKTDGRIVFLEDIGERPYRLDRTLTQLLGSGIFSEAAAVLIGQLTKCDGKAEDYSALDVVLERLEPLGIPILSMVPVGHEATSMPLPLGVPCTVDTTAETATFETSAS